MQPPPLSYYCIKIVAFIFLILPGAHAADTTEGVAAASVKTPKGSPFIYSKAVAASSLEEGGFAAKPAFQDDFSSGWEEQHSPWRVAAWTQNGAQMSPERCRTDAQGQLVQTVLAGEPYRGGSMQTDREFGYGRWIARVKPSSVPGVLNSVFVDDWDDLATPGDQHDGSKAEVDLEFVTHTFGKDRGEAHLAVHFKDRKPLWHLDIPLDFNPSDEFHDWGFDILPDRVVWHVDGKVLHIWQYTQEYKIAPGYEFFFNSWSRKQWIEGPPAAEARYLIDWVKFYPIARNNTATSANPTP